MLKDLFVFIKYPYTAGVIGTLWIASAILMVIQRDLNGFWVAVINTLATLVIAVIGFNGKDS
jgi:hypothetical protein